MKKNFIAAIVNQDGSVSNSLEQVASGFLGFYKELLGSVGITEDIDRNIINCGPVISTAQGFDLCKEVSNAEIKLALDSIGDDKAPGPDGFSTLFFKKAWGIVGPNIRAAVAEFFQNGRILRQLNHANIALIPKSSIASGGWGLQTNCLL